MQKAVRAIPSRHRKQSLKLFCTASAAPASLAPSTGPEIRGVGEVADVEKLEGVRVLLDEDARPFVEYLVKWKVCHILLGHNRPGALMA